MTSKTGITTLLFFALATVYSCHKDKNSSCRSYTDADAVKISGPASIAVNQQAAITISFYLYNGCGQYQGIESSTANNITTITLKAKYEGCICTAVLQGGEAVYKFSAATPGVYYFRCRSSSGNYIADTVVVN